MKRNIKRQEGGITLEASLFLPIFLIGILTVAYLMKFVYLQEAILYQLCREARIQIRQSVAADLSITYPLVVSHRLSQSHLETEFYRHRLFLYPLQTRLTDQVVHYEGKYYQKIPFPIQIYEGVAGKESVRFRPFVGRKYRGDAMDPKELEEKKESRMVWVFPKAGERYHERTCSVIEVFPHQTILTTSVRTRYRPCSHCRPEKRGNGSLVYCFPRAGEVYHQKACSLVTRYVIEIDQESAEAQGYTPCRLCGGSG